MASLICHYRITNHQYTRAGGMSTLLAFVQAGVDRGVRISFLFYYYCNALPPQVLKPSLPVDVWCSNVTGNDEVLMDDSKYWLF